MAKLPNNKELLDLAKRDQELRDASGQEVVGLPHGSLIRDVSVHADDRGMLFEVFDEQWGWHPDPLTRAYVSTILHPPLRAGLNPGGPAAQHRAFPGAMEAIRNRSRSA